MSVVAPIEFDLKEMLENIDNVELEVKSTTVSFKHQITLLRFKEKTIKLFYINKRRPQKQ